MSSTRPGARTSNSAPASLESRLRSRWGVGSAEVPADSDRPPGDPDSAARAICLSQLEHRARTRSELADALRRKEVDDDVAARVLDRLTEVGLIDDAALAQTLTDAAHDRRGLGRRAVEAKLRSRGIDEETVGAAVATIDVDSERQRAEELVTRRARSMQSLAPEVRSRRLIGVLARKGYPSAMTYDVVRSVLRDLE